MTARLRAGATVDGAFLAALTVLLFLAHEYLPLVGVIGSLFCPAPLVYAGVRHGLKTSLLTLVVAVLVLALVQPALAALFFFTFGVLGVIIGVGIRNQWRWGVITGVATILAVSTLAPSYWIYSRWMGVDPIGQSFVMVDKVFAEMMAIQEEAAAGDREKLEIIGRQREMFPYLKMGMPASLAIGELAMVVTNLVAAGWLLRRLRVPLLPTPEVRRFKCYDACAWGLVIGLGLLMMGRETPFPWVVGLNLTVFFAALFFLQGLAIIAFYFHRWKLHPLLRAVGYILIMLQIWPVVILAGTFDTWFDFRKLQAPVVVPEEKNDKADGCER